MTTAIVTKDSLKNMLSAENSQYVQTVIGRALFALLQRQTSSEQEYNTTQINNFQGFASCDAKSGSLTAKFWRKHNRLEDWMVKRWTKPTKTGYPYLCKYARQLNEIAAQKKS